MKDKPNTIEITNFYGALTRKKNGDINSGMAKFSTSFGYDPFSKPGQLTWLEQPTSIAGISDLVVDAKCRYESASSSNFVYALGNKGNLYKVQPNSITNPNVDSVIGVASVVGGATAQTYNFGGSIEFFGATEKIYAGGDKGVAAVNFDGTGDTFVGTQGNYTQNRYRPLAQFLGYLAFGNSNNIGVIDSTGTVISSVVSSHYEQLSPSLPQETFVTDLDPSVNGNYLNITTSGVLNEQIATVSSDRQASAGSKGGVYSWNGIDRGVTAFKTVPSYAVTAMQVYLENNSFFENDAFGASVSDGSNKKISLTGVKSAFANATTTNGNFLSWISPAITQNNQMVGDMFYYGQLDEDNPKGLWRVLRYSTNLATGFVYQTPVNVMVNNKYSTVNNAVTSVVSNGYGKHYFSSFEVNAANTTIGSQTAKLSRFLITPTGTGTPQAGVYETQNQLFANRVDIKQIRVYTEPTVTGNGFQIDVITNDGSVATNGTFTYSFSAGTDITLLQGAIERINFNPTCGGFYSFGLRITNTGTTNMVINKIEVDWEKSGK